MNVITNLAAKAKCADVGTVRLHTPRLGARLRDIREGKYRFPLPRSQRPMLRTCSSEATRFSS
jgi:hypothetical protein